MDYEPGKIPSKDEWETQTTSETKPISNLIDSITKTAERNLVKKGYDTFSESFIDPYGEKREQELQQKEQERKEKLAKARANADMRDRPFQSSASSQTDLFLEGFNETAKQPQSKAKNQDAIDFGENSETYKILQDLSKRWYATSDSAEKDRLHEVAEKVRRLARGNNPLKYGTDEIFDVMHRNAKLGQLVNAGAIGTIPIKTALTNPLLAGISGGLLGPSAFLTTMVVDKNQWNYKYNDHWRVGGEEGKDLKVFDGKDLDADNNRNWLPWIYFDGHLIGADKLGNMNMAYVGDKMGLPEWVYNNFLTRDKDDAFWVEYGRDLSRSGR